MWGSAGDRASQWIEYRFERPVTLNGARMRFWAGGDVSPPKAWRIEYWDRGWKPVRNPSGFGTGVDTFQSAAFSPVTTRCVRAVLDASDANGAYSGLAVQEWEVLAPEIQPYQPAAGAAPACEANP